MRGYALLTNACLERMGELSSIEPYTQTCEHIGEVECGVYDLHAYEGQDARYENVVTWNSMTLITAMNVL